MEGILLMDPPRVEILMTAALLQDMPGVPLALAAVCRIGRYSYIKENERITYPLISSYSMRVVDLQVNVVIYYSQHTPWATSVRKTCVAHLNNGTALSDQANKSVKLV